MGIDQRWYIRAISSVKFLPNVTAANVFAGAADSSRREYRPSAIPSTAFGTYGVVSEGRCILEPIPNGAYETKIRLTAATCEIDESSCLVTYSCAYEPLDHSAIYPKGLSDGSVCTS